MTACSLWPHFMQTPAALRAVHSFLGMNTALALGLPFFCFLLGQGT